MRAPAHLRSGRLDIDYLTLDSPVDEAEEKAAAAAAARARARAECDYTSARSDRVSKTAGADGSSERRRASSRHGGRSGASLRRVSTTFIGAPAEEPPPSARAPWLGRSCRACSKRILRELVERVVLLHYFWQVCERRPPPGLTSPGL